MTCMTTTAAGLELTAMMYAAPDVPAAAAAAPRGRRLAIGIVTAGVALWLATTLGVLTGLWAPPIPAEVSGRPAAAVESPRP